MFSVSFQITSFDSIGPCCDLLINCTGLSSYWLVPDHNVYAQRGQILHIAMSASTPFSSPSFNINKFYNDDEGPNPMSYLIPHPEHGYCVVGGTMEKIELDRYSKREGKRIVCDAAKVQSLTIPSANVTQDILHRICNILPSLRNGTIQKEWVGLRPCRQGGVRVEVEERYKRHNMLRIPLLCCSFLYNLT